MAPLLGVLFAILVALLAIRPYLTYQQQAFDNVKAANTAAQFRQIIDATQTYIQTNCSSSQSINTSSCSSISVSTLVSNGLLPNGTVSSNPYGQTWNIFVSSQNNAVQAFVYSTGGMPIPPQRAPEIAAETGAEGGFMPTSGQYSIYNVTAHTAVGAYGHWIATLPSGLSPIPAPGDLVAQLNVQTQNQDNDYLYRTQVQGDPAANTMGTNLNMGGNSITNATNLQTTDGSLGDSASIGTGTDTITKKTQAYLSVTGSAETNVTFGNGGTGTTSVNIGNNSTAPANVNIGSNNSNATNLEVGANASGTTNLDVGKNASGTTNLTIGSGASGTSDLTIGGNGAAGELVLTSAPQTLGGACTSAQLGTIAPSAAISPSTTSSGLPVVCTTTSQTGSLQVKNGIITIATSTSTSLTWQVLGGQNFTTLQEVNFQPFSVNGSTPNTAYVYTNSTSQPLFISSNCSLNQGVSGVGGSSTGGLFGLLGSSNSGTSINFYLSSTFSSNFSNLNESNGMEWTLSGVSLQSGGLAAPASSVIVPPTYSFAYSLYTSASPASCQFTVAY